jgi:hypothetical protein
VDERLAAVQVEIRGHGCDGVVRDGQEDQVGVIEDGGRFGKTAAAGNARGEVDAARLVAARDRGYGPAGTGEGDGQRGPDVTSTDESEPRSTVGFDGIMVVVGRYRSQLVHGPIVGSVNGIHCARGVYCKQLQQARPEAGTPARRRSSRADRRGA